VTDAMHAARAPRPVAVPAPLAVPALASAARAIIPGRTYRQAMFAAATASDEPASRTIQPRLSREEDSSRVRRRSRATIQSPRWGDELLGIGGLPEAISVEAVASAVGLTTQPWREPLGRETVARPRVVSAGAGSLAGHFLPSFGRDGSSATAPLLGLPWASPVGPEAPPLVGRMPDLKVDSASSTTSAERVSNRIEPGP
jgi:hypothetical protein